MEGTSSDTKEIERIAQQLGLDITVLRNEKRKRILIDYLTAVEQTFPAAWADTKRQHYALLLPTGLQIMISLLPDIMQRCDFYEGFTYNRTTFSKQLEPLVSLALLGDWAKSAVEDSISVRPRREMFFEQLKEALKVKPPSS